MVIERDPILPVVPVELENSEKTKKALQDAFDELMKMATEDFLKIDTKDCDVGHILKEGGFVTHKG